MADASAGDATIRGPHDIAGARCALTQARLGWLGQRATDVIPLLQLTNLDLIVTCEGGEDAAWLARQAGAALVALEHRERVRRVWSNASLDLLAGLDWMDNAAHQARRTDEQTLSLVAYCATPRWEARAHQPASKVRLLAPPASLKHLLDDKWAFRAQMAAQGLPVIPSGQVSRALLVFDQLATRFGAPFVAQTPFSSAGLGTFIIHTPDDLSDALAQAPTVADWLISRYMGTTTFNVNALVLADRVWIAPPSVQLTGIHELADGAGIYCGNDYGAMNAFPASVVAQITAQTRCIGAWLAQQGFIGAFGVDFIFNGMDVYPLELNPRFQGSTGLLGQWELANGQVPLIVLHALAWLGYRLDLPCDDATPSTLAVGSQAIVHLLRSDAKRIAAALPPGVYTLDATGAPHFLRVGQSVMDCRAGEYILAGAPQPGAGIELGAVIVRVLARERLAQPSGRALTSWGARVVAGVRRAALAVGAIPLPTLNGEARRGDIGGMV